MKITLRMIGALEEVIKEREFSFSDHGIRLDQFLDVLAERYGSAVKEHLFPAGTPSPHYFILLNGASIYRLNGFETELKDGDRILITTLVDGG